MTSEIPSVIKTIEQIRGVLQAERKKGKQIVFVPTMGALHDGHLALIRHARSLGGIVVLSIFVNPLQFNDPVDLDQYPRDIESDITLIGSNVDYVFAPTVGQMYPSGKPSTLIIGGAVADLFEGSSRPGHFNGMLTVVSKLLNIVQPDVAVFGQKDVQQVALIKAMIHDLNFAVTVDVVPTVRDSEGLALSSRNQFLSPEERVTAILLSLALRTTHDAVQNGTNITAAIAAGKAVLESNESLNVDYFTVVKPDTFQPVTDELPGESLIIVAARIGKTRLIDNMIVQHN